MKEIVGWILLAISCLGALYTIALIISYAMFQNRNDEYLADINCDCNGCSK